MSLGRSLCDSLDIKDDKSIVKFAVVNVLSTWVCSAIYLVCNK